MQRFRSLKTLQKFSSVHAQVHNQFNQERHLVTRQVYIRDARLHWRSGATLQGKASLASGRVALRVGECCYSDDANQCGKHRSWLIGRAGALDCGPATIRKTPI
jgi:hypothetical protein